jgi:hypothetical protein
MWNVVDRERAHSFHEQSRILNEISGSHPGEMAVFWDVATCNLVEIDRRFRDVYCLHYQGAGIAVSTSETCMYFYQTTSRNIPEDSYIHFNSYLASPSICFFFLSTW